MALWIDLYTRCWNDAHMLGFFFRHYDPLVQRYIVYDDGSTDGSLEILKAHPKVEIITPLPYSDPDSRVLSAQTLWENCWKRSRGAADWVVLTDIDEHLYHPDIEGYLNDCRARGVTIIPALGYQMLSDTFPAPDVHLARALTLGAPFVTLSKMNIFNPSEVKAINYTVGRHTAAPEGNITLPDRDELLLLHYKFMDIERLQARHELYRTRSRAKDLANGWGFHYLRSIEELTRVWEDVRSRLVDISLPGLNPWESHTEPRWWEPYRDKNQ